MSPSSVEVRSMLMTPVEDIRSDWPACCLLRAPLELTETFDARLARPETLGSSSVSGMVPCQCVYPTQNQNRRDKMTETSDEQVKSGC